MGRHDSARRKARGVDLNSPVTALAWRFSNSFTFSNWSFWPLHQIFDPYNATKVTAAITTLRIKFTDKPPLLLLRLDNRGRAPFGARHPVFEAHFERQHRIQPEAEPLGRLLLDGK